MLKRKRFRSREIRDMEERGKREVAERRMSGEGWRAI
jgi:hypothetical protein